MAGGTGARPVRGPAGKATGRGGLVAVTLGEHLRAEVDAEAGPGGRSGFLAQAARSALSAARVSDNLAKKIDESIAR